MVVEVEINGQVVASATLPPDSPPPTKADQQLIEAESLRLMAVDALVDAASRPDEASPAAPISNALARIAASFAKDVPAVAALTTTLSSEALPGMSDEGARRAWGRHYCRTLPLMLRAERRSNFRDAALQHFGKDACQDSHDGRLSGMRRGQITA